MTEDTNEHLGSSNCSSAGGKTLQQATEKWVDFVIEYYKNNRSLAQVHARGFFAGMSESEIVGLAKHMKASAEKYPVWEGK